MRTLLSVMLGLWTLAATVASGQAWTDPAGVLGVSWGAPVESVRKAFPGGQLKQETTLTAAYRAATTLDRVPVTALFQFVSGQGLQGVVLRFPANQLTQVAALFEGRYGRPQMWRNAEWEWEGSGVKISLARYPSILAPPPKPTARKGVAWLRTRLLEEAIAQGKPVRWPSADEPAPEGFAARGREGHSGFGEKPPSYEERILRKIYWELRYPATTAGVYLVSLAFQLSATGRATELELSADPPNSDVVESVRAAVGKAQPFPLAPAGPSRAREKPIALTLTVTIFP